MRHIVTRGSTYYIHYTKPRRFSLYPKNTKPRKKKESVINVGEIGEVVEQQLSVPSITNLGFHGFRRISALGNSFAAQISWSFLCTVFLMICIFQCYDRVKFFMKRPSSTNIKVQRNATILSPCVTICPSERLYRNPSVWKPWLRDIYNITDFSNAYDLLYRTNMSIQDLWNFSRIGMESLTYGTPEGYSLMNGWKMNSNSLVVKDLYTTGGICTTLKATKPLDCEGARANLFVQSEGNDEDLHHEYSVIFHSEEDTEIMKYFIRHFETQLSFRSETVVGIRLQQFTFPNTWGQPCIDGPAVTNCLIECVEKQIFSNLNKSYCSLPYMRLNASIPPCETQQQFHEVYSATDAAISGFDWDNCGCPRKCNEVVYMPEFYYNLNVPTEPELNHLFLLYVTFPDCRVEVIEEALAYSFFSLFSDIGGTLGLFLGISILSFCELFEVLFEKIFRK